MARQQQTPDTMTAQDENETVIRYGTALHRVNEIVDDQPADQESTEFYAGDIRDVLRLCDEKSFKDLRDKVKGKPVGESVSLPVAQCRQLVATAIKPGSTEAPAK